MTKKLDPKRRAKIRQRAAMTPKQAISILTTDDWGTPEWVCKLLGHFDLDPCSNARSFVHAPNRFVFEFELIARDAEQLAVEADLAGMRDEARKLRRQAKAIRKQMPEQIDGLLTEWFGTVFINCPYSDPLPWTSKAAAYRGPWVMLLKLDTTTKWWRVLMEAGAEWAPLNKRLTYVQPGKAMTANFSSVLVWRGDWEPSKALQEHLWMPRRRTLSTNTTAEVMSAISDAREALVSAGIKVDSQKWLMEDRDDEESTSPS